MAFSDLDALFNKEVSEETLKGCSILVEQGDNVLFQKAYGSDKDDSIYKIYSMSKPITSVAIMILYERGLLTLQDPVSKYLPAYNNMKVVTPSGILPAKNQITIKHLLDMTSGLCYPGDSTVSERAMQTLQHKMLKDVTDGKKLNTIEICNTLAQTPLEFEPGTSWKYGFSADVLGAVVEVISGMTFSHFLKKEIFQPLEMIDTDFIVPKEKLHRLAKMYSRNTHTKKCETPTPEKIQWLGLDNPSKAPNIESGGGGLYSTLKDYRNFAKMLCNSGFYINSQNQKIQILSKKTINFMTKPNVSEMQKTSNYLINMDGYEYGNLFRIMTDLAKANSNGTLGEFGWDGLPGTYFMVDPKEDLILVYLQQIAEGTDWALRSKYRQIVYSSISPKN